MMKHNKHTDAMLSMLPVVVLIVQLVIVIHIFGSAALDGASQVALTVSAGVACLVAMRYFNVPWRELETGVQDSISGVTSALLILLLIGALAGIWILSGVVPSLIYYGLQIMHPKLFLVSTCVICCLVSVLTGSSWSTIATIGIALLGIGQAQGFDEGLVGGAIISGSYFGDKMSPLSDTTVLASSMSEVPLFTHIRYIAMTTVPAIVITLLIFTILGLTHTVADGGDVAVYTEALRSRFNITPWLLLVPAGTFLLIARKMPALIVLFLGTLFGVVFALIFQPHILTEVAGAAQPDAESLFVGVVRGIYDSTSIDMGNELVTELVATHGMTGMLNTIFLIICAVSFGGCMTSSGMLQHITNLIMPLTRKRAGLVASTVGTGIFMNGVASDQYLAIIITANMYKGVYAERGYENRLMSRSVEDSATVTSPLFPWSSCGMTQATILNVPTMTYLPYCFFNLLCPVMSILVALTGFKIYKRVAGKDGDGQGK